MLTVVPPNHKYGKRSKREEVSVRERALVQHDVINVISVDDNGGTGKVKALIDLGSSLGLLGGGGSLGCGKRSGNTQRRGESFGTV
jgi:hypothetical protein